MASSTRGIMKPLALITDFSTRWNSQYYQIAQFVQLKSVVFFKCEEDLILHKYRLTNYEWAVIEHRVVFLKPLEVATKLVGGSSYPTFSSAIPTYEWLIQQIERVSGF